MVKAKLPKPQKTEEPKPVELPDDIPGQTEIEKDFPELLPEPAKIPETQSKEPDCTSAMPEPVENGVDNSEQVQENAINTEMETDSEQVDNSEKETAEQNPVGSRWEYIKTMEPYKMALYMAASVNEMPHMMLGSAEYWKKWLEAEVDENGDEISKRESDS